MWQIASSELRARADALLNRLAERGGTWTHRNASVDVRVDGITVELRTYEDAFVLSEVFGEHVYGIRRPRPAVVIDVGAHIGISALYFARQPWVTQVHAFEPMPPTAALARANFMRNSRLAHKIQLHEYGLGVCDETIDVDYSLEWKANVGRNGMPAHLPKITAPSRQPMVLRNASACIAAVLREARPADVVVKMDCEGAEWEILPELAASGVLRHIDHVMLEFHGRAPDALQALLLDESFSVFYRPARTDNTLGMIYASLTARRPRHRQQPLDERRHLALGL